MSKISKTLNLIATAAFAICIPASAQHSCFDNKGHDVVERVAHDAWYLMWARPVNDAESRRIWYAAEKKVAQKGSCNFKEEAFEVAYSLCARGLYCPSPDDYEKFWFNKPRVFTPEQLARVGAK